MGISGSGVVVTGTNKSLAVENGMHVLPQLLAAAGSDADSEELMKAG